MRIYISGKISGENIEETTAKFERASYAITNQGNEAINPMNNGLGADAPKELHMVVDILLLMGCNAIMMLPDWIYSSGAITELSVAQSIGLKVMYEQSDEKTKYMKPIADILRVDMSDIASKSRKIILVYARMILTQLMRERGKSVSDIQGIIGKSYATVLHYIDIYNDEKKYNATFRELEEAVKTRININD
jgi:hypothetical protein